MKPILSASIAVLIPSLAFSAQPAPTPGPAPSEASTPQTLPDTVVSSTPLGRTLFEQVQPVSVLTGEKLPLLLQPTLGDTLSGIPGVSSSSFGPAASRPVIRGLDADRIRILQNGSNTIDASSTSPDHAVSYDPVSAQSIEVVRGPATLLYGPNAIGGVVNVLDNRIPEDPILTPIRGSLSGRYGSINSEQGGNFILEGGASGFNWHLEGYKRATDDLHIPGFARSGRLRARAPLEAGESEARDVLPNSNLRTEGLLGGASYTWDEGYFGLAYSGFHSNYGTVAEKDVTIDLEQRRWDFRGAFLDPIPGIHKIKYTVGISDYQHTEFEQTLVGTVFENEGYDARLEITHEPIGRLEGTFGFQSEKSTFSAIGDEAFLPAVETRVQSAFVFEELPLEPFRFQFGLRYDHAEVESDSSPTFGPGSARDFDNLSGSLGLLFTPVQGYVLALNTALTQRAPTYQELFANGPHIATGSFEVGDPLLDPEKCLSFDLSLRKKTGWVTGSVGGFMNYFKDFVGMFPTGAFSDDEEEPLPVYQFRSTDARFVGGEVEATIHLLQPLTDSPDQPAQILDLELKTDYVHATDADDSRPLPRIPPFRSSAGLVYQNKGFRIGVEGQYSARQNRTAEEELPTDSFFLVNAHMSYRIPLGANTQADFFVKGVNLANQEARLHTSLLKDIAPMGGRGVLCGVKLSF
jgi:iron complex outermembrane receptor protein